MQTLLVRSVGDYLINVIHCCVFERTGGISPRIANNRAAGNFGSLRIDSGELEGQRVRYSHVSVVAAEEDGSIRSDVVDVFLRGKSRRSPFRIVPIAAKN